MGQAIKAVVRGTTILTTVVPRIVTGTIAITVTIASENTLELFSLVSVA